MTGLEDREQALEGKFAHDQELSFRIDARRDRLLGEWAAQQLGLQGASAESYAKSVVFEDLKQAGSDDVIAKILADFKAKSLDISEHRIRKMAAELRVEAEKQVRSE